MPSNVTLIDYFNSNGIGNTNVIISGIIITDVADYLGVFYQVKD